MGVPVSIGDKCTLIFLAEINLELEVNGTPGFLSDKRHSSVDGFVSRENFSLLKIIEYR